MWTPALGRKVGKRGMSIFGNFYGRIHGSVEFLASESLNYILNSSDSVNKNLVNLINLDNNTNFSDITFNSQVQGENLEIPDLSGFDENKNEVIILEAKFWASLTDNQPLTYLNRLSENGVLAFICPDLRKISLQSEILYTLKESNIEFRVDSKIIKIGTKNIIIYSWDSVLNALKNDIGHSEFDALSDINQLKGLCEKIDANSFLPLTDEDLSPAVPRKILSYYRIVDKVIDKLAKEINLSTKGLKTTGQQWGYTRYAKIEDLTIELDVNFEYWAKYADTPIWLQISENWSASPAILKINSEIEKKYGKIDFSDNNKPYYPIRINTGAIEESVINAISEFIKVVHKIYTEYK